MTGIATPPTALFFSGIHIDMLGRLAAPALSGVSNPGKFTSMAGGASLNTASVASLLGLDCAIIGLIGDDEPGKTIIRTLAERSITSHMTVCEGKATGSYTSIIEPDGNLHIAIADLGLNEQISADWLFETWAEALAGSDIWFVNSNLSSDTLEALSNPGLSQRPKILAAASISPSKSRHLVSSLSHIDVLFTNIAEASAMLNVITGKPYDGPKLGASQCIDGLRNLGLAKGSLSQGGEALWVWEEQDTHKFIPPKLNKIIDVTGAGDALAGTFLSGLAQGRTMSQIAPLAIAAAQMTLSALGPYNEKMTTDELNLIANNVKAGM